MALTILRRNGLMRFAFAVSLALVFFSSTVGPLFAQSFTAGSDLKVSYQEFCGLPNGALRGSRSGVKIFSKKPDAQGKRVYYVGGKGGCYIVFEAMSHDIVEFEFYDLFEDERDYELSVSGAREDAVSQHLAKKIVLAKEKCSGNDNKTFVPKLGGTKRLSCIKDRLVSDLKDLAWIHVDFAGDASLNQHSSNLWFDNGVLIGIIEVHEVDGVASYPSWPALEGVK